MGSMAMMELIDADENSIAAISWATERLINENANLKTENISTKKSTIRFEWNLIELKEKSAVWPKIFENVSHQL